MPLWQCSIHPWILGNLAHKMRQGMLGGGSMWEELLIWAVLWRRRSTKRNPFDESHLDLSVHMFLRWQIPRLLVQPTWAKFLQNWKLYWGAKRWGSQYIFAEQNQHGFFGVCVCVCVCRGMERKCDHVEEGENLEVDLPLHLFFSHLQWDMFRLSEGHWCVRKKHPSTRTSPCL